jgi:hypothetical protein
MAQFTKQVSGGRSFTIYAEQPNIDYFLAGFEEADAQGEVESRSANFEGSTAKRFPGDPNPVTRSGGTRQYLYDPNRVSRRALPGRTIILSEVTGDPAVPGETRSFTLRGRWLDFHAYAMGAAKVKIKAFNSSGAYSVIAAV